MPNTAARPTMLSGCDNGAFALDAASPQTLTEQLADNLRRAIANGLFKPGDKLPGVRQMAKLCGTSVQVPIDALKALAEEELVKARPRIGCVVLGKSRKSWRGSVLVVHVGAYTNYSQNAFCAETARLLESANWRVEHAFVHRDGVDWYDLSSFRKVLSGDFDLILLPAYDMPVIELVQKRGVPYMLLAAHLGEVRDGCIGITVQSDRRASADFAAHCREAGVQHVLRVTSDVDAVGAADILRADGVEVEDVVIHSDCTDATAENFAQRAFEALVERFGDRRSRRPDLVFFGDDYFARGGLWALERCGLRVPEDVKVVTLVNSFNSPFYPKSLTRFEHSPLDEAQKMVQMVMRYFKTGRPPRTVLCDTRYIRGETFR